jgi:hypothetical protein
MRSRFAWLAVLPLLAAFLGACGGAGVGTGVGEVSGVIFDEDGDVVRDALVWVGTRRVSTNSSGAYVLEKVPAGDTVIRAEVRRGQNRFAGQNVANVAPGERTKNVNIAVYALALRANLSGSVRTRDGFFIAGARVFARPTDASQLTSAVAVTDRNGVFRLNDLRSGIDYEIQVNALGYNTDFEVVNLNAGETRALDFILGGPANPALPAPENLEAIAWTSPPLTRARDVQAVEAMKHLLSPKRPQTVTTRLTPTGHLIEIDLFWDRLNVDSLLGYGIFRSVEAGPINNVEFLRDPMAELYADLDPSLQVGSLYTYRVTALNTSFQQGNPATQSPFSEPASARPIGELTLGPVQQNPLRINWNPVAGAQSYAVFFFSEFPRIGIGSFFNTASARVTGTTYTYDGPALQAGQTYYYIVLAVNQPPGVSIGLANARSISPVGSFVR